MEDPAPSPEPIYPVDSGRVSWGRVIITLMGLGLGAYLVVNHGWDEVLRALQAVGWPGLAGITLFHVLPTLVCGLAWWSLLRPHLRESWVPFVWLRWIRDGSDGVVPILPVSGELIVTRLLRLRGTPLAGAGVIVDVTTELLAQLLFAIIGFALLVTTHRGAHHLSWVVLGLAVMSVQFGGFLIAQKKGLFRLLERPFDWLKRRWRGAGAEPAAEARAERTLHEQILQIHAHRRAFFGSILLHLAAWIIGALEAWICLQLMGHPLDVPDVLVLESLVTAIRSIIFFVPLAAGVQEAGYVLVGGLLGLPGGIALAISLVKRARDLIKGVPAVLMWQLLERRAARRPAARAASRPSA
jgi:putative membrane protein